MPPVPFPEAVSQLNCKILVAALIEGQSPQLHKIECPNSEAHVHMKQL